MQPVERPRILLVPTISEVEWRIRPQLERWAEVASYDAPGIGDEPPAEPTARSIVERGLAELDRLGWDSCVVAGDEIGAAQAIRLAAARPEAVWALALGHPTLSLRSTGPRAPISGEMQQALLQIARADYRSFVRALTQLTQYDYDEEFAREYMERVSHEVLLSYLPELLGPVGDESLEPALRELDAALLLVEHEGCLMWTREGYEAVVTAFPEARSETVKTKPSVNPEFSELLRDFCDSL